MGAFNGRWEGSSRKHCLAGRTRDLWPYRMFFPVSNQLSSWCERPPGTARSEGEGVACPGRMGQVLGGDLGLSSLLLFRGIQASGGFWAILVARGSR